MPVRVLAAGAMDVTDTRTAAPQATGSASALTASTLSQRPHGPRSQHINVSR